MESKKRRTILDFQGIKISINYIFFNFCSHIIKMYYIYHKMYKFENITLKKYFETTKL